MKRIVSLLLAVAMSVSAVPTAFAADTQDHSLGTQVVFTAANNENYTITVPASLNPGQSGTVTLDGYWPDSKTVTVTAEKTVTLTNSIKAADTKTLNVTFNGISEAGSNTSKQTFTEPVSVEGISNALFGTWSGKFNYNVDSVEEEVVPPAENYIGTVSADNTITLSGVESAGTYTLRYANANGALENYADICSLEVTDPATAVSYDDLIAENCAPVEATSIAVYNASNEKVGDIALGGLKTNLGTKLYSFGALADIHIGEYNAVAKTENALDYLTTSENVAFTCIPGDLTATPNQESLSSVKNIIDKYSNSTVYVSAGNHDTSGYVSDIENFEEYLESYLGYPLCYSFEYGNDMFLMVGISSSTQNRFFQHGQLQWLQEQLEANKNKRCFVFQHIFPGEGSGNPNNSYPYDALSGQELESFENLMSHYKNAVYLHGHSHSLLSLQSIDDTANYDYSNGVHSIHIPSVTKPRDENGADQAAYSEGYVIDVYESGIILRGINFVQNELLPIALYELDTSTKPIQQDEILVKVDLKLQPGIKLSKTDSTYEEVSYDHLTDTKTYMASDYLPINANTPYTVGLTRANYTNISICCFDENKNFVGYLENVIKGPTDGTEVEMNTTITPPEGTAYIRLRIYVPINKNNPARDKMRYPYAYKKITVS